MIVFLLAALLCAVLWGVEGVAWLVAVLILVGTVSWTIFGLVTLAVRLAEKGKKHQTGVDR